MTVGELLGILRITKQSLNRVLGQLVRQGFIAQHRGPDDRRQRLLELTDSGRELERRLSSPQRARVAAAYRAAGTGAVEGFREVLLGILAEEEDRARFQPERESRTSASCARLTPDCDIITAMSDLEPHLLVVDDDARLRALLRRYLSDNGFRVRWPPMPLRRAPASRALHSILSCST